MSTLLATDLASLTSAEAADLGQAVVAGVNGIRDGGAGIFVWDAASTEAPDGENVLALDAGGTGRWVRNSPTNVTGNGGARRRLWTRDNPTGQKVWEDLADEDRLILAALKDDLSDRVVWLAVERGEAADWDDPTTWGEGLGPNGKGVIRKVVVAPRDGFFVANLEGGGYDLTESCVALLNAYDVPTNVPWSGMGAVGADGSLVIFSRPEEPRPIRFFVGGGRRVQITGCGANPGGKVRLTVTSTAKMASGQLWYVKGVDGTPEVNGPQIVTVIDATHVDLLGGWLTNAADNQPCQAPAVDFVAGDIDPAYAWMQDGATEAGRFHQNGFFGVGPFRHDRRPYGTGEYGEGAYQGESYMPDRRMSVWSDDAAENVLGVTRSAAATVYHEFEAAGTTVRPRVGASGDDLVLGAGSAQAKVSPAGVLSAPKLGAGNAAVASTPGSVVRKLEVFDQSGASLGFLAVYGSIS